MPMVVFSIDIPTISAVVSSILTMGILTMSLLSGLAIEVPTSTMPSALLVRVVLISCTPIVRVAPTMTMALVLTLIITMRTIVSLTSIFMPFALKLFLMLTPLRVSKTKHVSSAIFHVELKVVMVVPSILQAAGKTVVKGGHGALIRRQRDKSLGDVTYAGGI